MFDNQKSLMKYAYEVAKISGSQGTSKVKVTVLIDFNATFEDQTDFILYTIE